MDATSLFAQTFRQKLVVGLISVDGGTIPVAADLSYDTSDPYALTICYHLKDGSVPWTFARDLLSGGLAEPIGDGDLHVWPSLDDAGLAVVTIEFCSPYGDAMIEVRTADALGFVERSHALVAPGTESAHLDLDGTIAAIWVAENV